MTNIMNSLVIYIIKFVLVASIIVVSVLIGFTLSCYYLLKKAGENVTLSGAFNLCRYVIYLLFKKTGGKK